MFFQVLKNWVRARAIDINFFGDCETHSIIYRAKLRNFRIASWFLVGELIAREPDYYQTGFRIFFMKFLKTCVLGRQAAFTSGVDDENRLILELA